MEYLLLLYSNPSGWEAMSEAEQHAAFGAYGAYTQALTDAGAHLGGRPLERAETATTVTVAPDGKKSVLDGPFVDSKEQLAGFYLIDVANLDEALSWAARCPGAHHGTVEVRAVMAIPASA